MKRDIFNKYWRSCRTDKAAGNLAYLIEQEVAEALWDLHEYMGQFPDDLNLAVMSDRIKLVTSEQPAKTWESTVNNLQKRGEMAKLTCKKENHGTTN